MLTLEEQIERVAEAAVEGAGGSDSPLVVPVRPRAKSLRWTAVAAGLLVAALFGALAWMLVARNAPPAATDQVPAPRPIPSVILPANEPTVEPDSDQEWLIPSELPDGFQYEHAFFSPGFGTDLAYRAGIGDQTVEIRTEAPTITSLTADETITIDGVEWSISEQPQDDGSVFRQIFRIQDIPSEYDAVGIIVRSNIERADLVAIVASLKPTPAAELPRPPLPTTLDNDNGIVAAEATANGVPTRLLVQTDGINFAMSVDGGGGSPNRLDPGGFITVGGAMSSRPDLVLNGTEAESMLWGLAHPDVATVDLELTDGRIVTSDVQDRYGFNENFFLIAFPTRTEGGMELLANVVARSADGTELQRLDGTFL